MKKILFLLAVIVAATLGSCTQGDEPVTPLAAENGVKVVSLGDYLGSRSGSDSLSNEDVLWFDDDLAYQSTIHKLQSMTPDERDSYFNEIGFEGAYTIVRKAEMNLDSIFDMEEADSVSIDLKVREYRTRYANVLELNTEDEYDLTPYLKFVDDTLELVGSAHGYIVVGNNVISAQHQNHKGPKPAYDGKFIEFKKATVSVKNKKYKSELTLGRMGDKMAFRVRTFRSIFFWKKYDKGCGHDGTLEFWRGNVKSMIKIHHKKGDYITPAIASKYSPYVNMKVTNFSCTRNSNNTVTKTINSILVK